LGLSFALCVFRFPICLWLLPMALARALPESYGMTLPVLSLIPLGLAVVGLAVLDAGMRIPVRAATG